MSFCPGFNVWGQRCDVCDFKSGVFWFTWSLAPSVSLQTMWFHSFLLNNYQLYISTTFAFSVYPLIGVWSALIVDSAVTRVALQASLLRAALIPSGVTELWPRVLGLDHLMIELSFLWASILTPTVAGLIYIRVQGFLFLNVLANIHVHSFNGVNMHPH